MDAFAIKIERFSKDVTEYAWYSAWLFEQYLEQSSPSHKVPMQWKCSTLDTTGYEL